jgi:hypothetical protein
MSEIFTARNIHRTRLKEATTNNMNADFISDVIDFKEMVVGSIQVMWDGNNADDATIVVEATNFVEHENSFDEIDCSEVTLDDDGSKAQRKTKLFNLGIIGWRYARVKYFHGSNTTGSISVWALGKKGG